MISIGDGDKDFGVLQLAIDGKEIKISDGNITFDPSRVEDLAGGVVFPAN